MQTMFLIQDKWHSTVFILFGIFIAIADQLSKTWIRTNLLRGQSLFDSGFFRITHVNNSGAAFGLFPDQTLALTFIAVAGVVVILVCALFVSRNLPFLNSMLGMSVLGLILGGTVGNLIDRIRLGYVTDFIDFSFWPTFNVADSAVTIGVIVIAYLVLRSSAAVKN